MPEPIQFSGTLLYDEAGGEVVDQNLPVEIFDLPMNPFAQNRITKEEVDREVKEARDRAFNSDGVTSGSEMFSGDDSEAFGGGGSKNNTPSNFAWDTIKERAEKDGTTTNEAERALEKERESAIRTRAEREGLSVAQIENKMAKEAFAREKAAKQAKADQRRADREQRMKDREQSTKDREQDRKGRSKVFLEKVAKEKAEKEAAKKAEAERLEKEKEKDEPKTPLCAKGCGAEVGVEGEVCDSCKEDAPTVVDTRVETIEVKTVKELRKNEKGIVAEYCTVYSIDITYDVYSDGSEVETGRSGKYVSDEGWV